MKKNAISILVSSVLLGLAIASVSLVFAPRTYEGNDLEFVVRRFSIVEIVADSDDVLVAAGGCSFFSLQHQDTMESIIGQPSKSLLGGGCSTYHRAEGQRMPTGILETDVVGFLDMITLSVTGDNVKVSVADPLAFNVLVSALLVLMFFVLWLVLLMGPVL